MNKPNVLKFALSECGLGSMSLNGVDIGGCVTGISYKGRSGELAEITLTLVAEVDAEVESRLDKLMIEKERLVYPGSYTLPDGRVRHTKA